MSEASDHSVPIRDVALQRARLLFSARRYEAAVHEMRRFLVHEPDDSEAHSLLSLCLSEIEDNEAIAAARGFSEALREAAEGIRRGPDQPYAYYAHAVALEKLKRYGRAEAAIREAIRLNPEESLYHGFLAYLQVCAGSWGDALATSEIGLSIDPNNARCTNIRGFALIYLDRYEEAATAAHLALAADPENAIAHGILGSVDLQGGRAKSAVGHFETALRLDPSLDWAVEANIEAQQKCTLFYRVLLCPVYRLADLSGPFFAALVISGWVGAHVASRLAKGQPDRVVPVALGLIFYVLLNAVVLIADPLLRCLVPLSRISKPDGDVKTNISWTTCVAIYLASLALLPVCLFWPDALALSVLVDVILVGLSCVVASMGCATIVVLIIFVALDLWLRG